MRGMKRAVGLLLDHMDRSHQGNKKRSLRQGYRAVPPEEHVAKFTLSYLDAFGYLQEELSQWKDISLGDIVDAVKQFQNFFGLKKTGEVCAKTVRAMHLPRCGCPDIVRARHKAHRGLRDFAQANLPRWQKTGIFYAVADYLPGFSKPDFDSVIYQSFQNWCRHANVSVEPARGSQRPDIVITVGRGPQDNFDGPGGTLAWAYLPDGRDDQLVMKFDLDETWILNPAQRGVLVQNVSCHEFGHLLGLDHSRLESALMAPYYNAALAVPQQQDDIPRLQVRYGVRQDSGPPAGGGEPVLVTVQGYGKHTVEVNGQRVAG